MIKGDIISGIHLSWLLKKYGLTVDEVLDYLGESIFAKKNEDSKE